MSNKITSRKAGPKGTVLIAKKLSEVLIQTDIADPRDTTGGVAFLWKYEPPWNDLAVALWVSQELGREVAQSAVAYIREDVFGRVASARSDTREYYERVLAEKDETILKLKQDIAGLEERVERWEPPTSIGIGSSK